MKPALQRWLPQLVLAFVALTACRQNTTVIVPNRVLDRPLDVTLACVRREGDTLDVLAPSQCDSGSRPTDCEEDDVPQLIGFIANSEKNEVGMFRRCDVNGMVDLDPEAPGYNLIPVGRAPSRIVQTPDCRIVTANVGSCDLSAIEMPALASYAVGLPLPVAPSGLVSTIVPRRSDGTPLGARPGDMITAPRGLSLADSSEDPEDGDEDGAAGESTGGDGVGTVCDPDISASVYITFPACQLVAEVSLATQRILQSRQFVIGDDGELTLVDSGPDPVCPIECPDQFDGDLPEDVPNDVDGAVNPRALALVRPDDDPDAIGDERDAFDRVSLFVGGNGSDEVFEIPLQREGGNALGFAPPAETLRLELENPAGIEVIRATPRTQIGGTIYQFLYIVAGDGSTHVVSRSPEGATLGVECDTQVDPSRIGVRACHPIDAGSASGQSDRRPFAAGPGIRGSDGSTVTDWTFQRSVDSMEVTRSPFDRRGVVGIGSTSFGRMTLAVFGQFEDLPNGVSPSNVDPEGLLDIDIRPHMLWPITDPESGLSTVLPLVSDEQPNRVLPGDDQVTQVLAPSLRRIDLAYFADGTGDFSELQEQVWTALGFPENRDELGGFDDDDSTNDNFVYENVPVRVAVRDYRQWRGGQLWQMVWEPAIPGTESSTGRLECEDPSDYFGGTCHVGPRPDDGTPDREPEHYEVRIVDEGATFCDEGVLPGDKLVLFGCGGDDECGPGRRCLRDPSTPGTTSGICISAGAYESELDQLRQICAPFISDPCGAPRREYIVTSATQTELSLGAMDIPATTFMRAECPVPSGRDNVLDPLGAKPPEPTACIDRLPVSANGGCSDDAYDVQCGDFCYPTGARCDDELLGLQECEARLTCRVPTGREQPPGGCTSDSECVDLGLSESNPEENGAQYVCIDGVCRTPCEGGSFNCRQALLPGPGCFSEFVRYAVATRETFVVSLNPAQQFITDRVITDPATGACVEDTTVSNLLTSRIRLGADEASTFARIADCPNADEAAPSDPNPCRITTLRADDDASPYHAFSYQGEPVEALRFSNPYGTVVVDMVSLLDLAAPTDLLENGLYPSCYTEFRRARIPRNYREEFATPSVSGYSAYNDPIVVGSTPLTYPVRLVNAPERGSAYVVDAGGRGGVTGVRGQIVRLTVANGAIRGDEQFRVR